MVIEYLQRKKFEQVVNCLPEDFTTNDLGGILIYCMKLNMIIPNVVNVEEISYNKLALLLVDGENVAYEIPAWYRYWPGKIMSGYPEDHTFTVQEIRKEIDEITHVEDEMYRALRETTGIENFKEYCQLHANEDLPYWMYWINDRLDYLDYFLQTVCSGYGIHVITGTEWICMDQDDPYFAEIRLPDWIKAFFAKAQEFYSAFYSKHLGEESLTWGHIASLI